MEALTKQTKKESTGRWNKNILKCSALIIINFYLKFDPFILAPFPISHETLIFKFTKNKKLLFP